MLGIEDGGPINQGPVIANLLTAIVYPDEYFLKRYKIS